MYLINYGQFPFARITIFYILGILLAQYLNHCFAKFLIPILLLVLFVLHFVNYFSTYNFRNMFGIISLALFVSLGTFNFQQAKTIDSIGVEEGDFVARIYTTPQEKENSFLIESQLFKRDSATGYRKIPAKTLLYLAKDGACNRLEIGDYIVFKGQLQTIKNRNNPGEFDYKNYLLRKGVSSWAYLRADDWHKSTLKSRPGLTAIAAGFQLSLVEQFSKLELSDNQRAVLSALTLGYKEDLSEEVRSSFSSAGAMHVLAVSGLHVGIVYSIVLFVFGLFRKSRFNRILQFIFSILIIWGYALLTGLSPSVVRASVMLSFICTGILIDKNIHPLNSVFASAFVMLLFNPYYIFNLGFQLSYSAVISIVVLIPLLSKVVKTKNKFVKPITDLVNVTIAAQIGTLPLVLFYFNQFPVYFMLTNFVVFLLVAFIIYISFFTLIFSKLAILFGFFSFLLEQLVGVFTKAVEFIANLPGSTINDIYINKIQFTVLILFILTIVYSFVFNRKRSLLLSAFFAILFVSINMYLNIQANSQYKVQVYNSNMFSAAIIKGNTLYTIGETVNNNHLLTPVKKQSRIKRCENVPMQVFVMNGDTLFDCATIAGERWVNITNDGIKEYSLNRENSFRTDVLIFSTSDFYSIDRLIEFFKPTEVIIGGNIPHWVEKRWKQSVNESTMHWRYLADGYLELESH